MITPPIYNRIKVISSALVIMLLVFCFFSGCSPTTRYKVLCVFFDGVPDPNASEGAGGEEGNSSSETLRANVRRGIKSYHKPYRSMKCYSCHTTPDQKVTGGKQALLTKTVEGGLCQTCHKTIPDEVPYVHAPALINDCLECHHHHQAPYRKLLLKGGDNLCYRCHSKKDLSEGEHHLTVLTNMDGFDTTCVKCHNPHHGKSRYFLKDLEISSSSESKSTKAIADRKAQDVKENKK